MDDFGNVFPLGANKGAASWMDEHKRNWKPLSLAASPAQPAAHVDYPCRTDGRCQYAIESGAEGMGHCPKGKCVMAQPAQAQPARLSDERIDEIASAMFYADEPMDSMARALRPQWLESIARPLAHAIAAAVVPPGFVVVPEEPTEAMRKAGDDTNAVHIYRAMLAAAAEEKLTASKVYLRD